MKKIAFVMGLVAAVLLTVACSKGSSRSDKYDDEDEEEEVSVSGADVLNDLSSLFKKALHDREEGCKTWDEEGWLDFYKELTSQTIDFYEADPTAEEWLKLRNLLEKNREKMVKKLNLTDRGVWPYEQLDNFELDKEAKKLEAKLKKIYTKWKKAHAEELAEVIARPQEEAEESDDEREEDVEDNPDGDDGIVANNDDDPVANNDDADDEIYVVAETMPHFASGSHIQWIKQNMKYPEDAEEADKDGTVVCQFVVEKDGSLTDIKVIKGVYPSLDAEALRLIRAMPKWIPGSKDGKKVRVRFTLPIRFALK